MMRPEQPEYPGLMLRVAAAMKAMGFLAWYSGSATQYQSGNKVHSQIRGWQVMLSYREKDFLRDNKYSNDWTVLTKLRPWHIQIAHLGYASNKSFANAEIAEMMDYIWLDVPVNADQRTLEEAKRVMQNAGRLGDIDDLYACSR